MRGEGAPSPIYEGEDGVIAWLLGGPEAEYSGAAARAGRAEAGDPRHLHQGALGRVPGPGAHRPRASDARAGSGTSRASSEVVIHTSHHTHNVIGTGSSDPQKMDPAASRETLDHSIMYIVAVALEDGAWHHERSYAPDARAAAPTPCGCGTRSAPSRTRSGRAATTPTRAGVRRPRIVVTLERRHRHRGRARRRRRAPPRGAALRRAPVRREVPDRSPTASSSRPSRTASSTTAGRARRARPRRAARPDVPRRRRPARRSRCARGDLRPVSGPCSPPAVRAEAPAGVPRRPRLRSAAADAREHSRRSSPWPSRTPASRASTSPAPPCRPTSACPTSGSRRSPRSPAAAAQIARATDLPTLIDADTGFGEPMNVARTVAAARGRRPRRLPPRGPGQPEALRAPRRQGARADGRDGPAHRGGRRRPPRPGLRHLRPHRRPRRSRASTRPSTGASATSTPGPT